MNINIYSVIPIYPIYKYHIYIYPIYTPYKYHINTHILQLYMESLQPYMASPLNVAGSKSPSHVAGAIRRLQRGLIAPR